MSPIHSLNRDDAGLQRLKETNASRAAGAVAQVNAPPVADERPAEAVPVVRARPQQERRSGDRRQGQRRRTPQTVLLDTRQRHERRHQQRRKGEQDRLGDDAPHGIDILI